MAAICVADVAKGLRNDAFDLVAGNAPWVPMPASSDAPRELFSYGGETGVELPRRFLQEGAALLRPGGIAITLALDVELHDGRRPLREAVDLLAAEDHLTAVVPTPWNRERPDFVDVMRARQPSLVDAEHVAVIAARPRDPGETRLDGRHAQVIVEKVRDLSLENVELGQGILSQGNEKTDR